MIRLAALALTLTVAACSPTLAPLSPDAGPPLVDDAGPLLAELCVDEAVVRARVLEPRCGSSDCHDTVRPSAGLDLVSPGIDARVIGATSVHEECLERVLVVPGAAPASFLMDKVLGREGACGDPMPREGELSLEERRCLVEWIGAM